MLRLALVLSLSLLSVLGTAGPAHAGPADRVAELSKTLTTSGHHKARIGAAVSLGRLKDKRGLKALITALRDDNRTVRAVAAAALGRIGDRRAIYELQRVAAGDSDELVRKRAAEAIERIEELEAEAHRARAVAAAPRRRAGFGNAPHAVRARPSMYVVIKTTSDESQIGNKKERQARAAQLGSILSRELRTEPRVTLSAQEAGRHRLERHVLDVAVTRMTRSEVGRFVEIECELRVAISDGRGRMRSFVTGGAKVQIPRRSFKRQYLDLHRKEALENAVKGLRQNLIRHLGGHDPS